MGPMDLFTLIPRTIIGVTYPLPYSFPTYLVLKCAFLAWCMAPVDWNGSDVIFNNILFPLFKQHHKEIEEQAAIAHKTFMEKLGICSKNKADKSDKGEKITKSLFKKMESSDKKESDKKET